MQLAAARQYERQLFAFAAEIKALKSALVNGRSVLVFGKLTLLAPLISFIRLSESRIENPSILMQ